MHPLLNIAITAARKAGATIMRSIDRLETIQISAKDNNDIVTNIDTLVEQEIIQTIHKAYPAHNILAEECGNITREEDNYLWIIDPIDGTLNFSHGLPHFAVSIAVQYKDRIEHGVVYDPIRQELFTASRGGGARLNQYRMRVSPCLSLSNALIGTGFPHRDLSRLSDYLQDFEALTRRVRGIRRAGSAALDLAYVAAGRFDGFWEYDLKLWDMAAGLLLVSEAGGLLAEPNGGDNYAKSGNIVAANQKLLAQMLEALKKI